MKLYSIETGHFKLDGGAMFGVVPKSLWQRTNPADQNNMIDIAATSLLIEDGKQLILIDTGLGNKQSDKFFSYYFRWGDHTLDKSLAKHGFHRYDITDVFMTHLHFDHCGGSVQWNKDKTGYEPAFKNAKFWTNKEHWDWAINPNDREKASFLKENLLPMQESGQLHFLDRSEQRHFYKELNFEVFFADGHTDKQMIPIIEHQNKKLVFAADLLPTAGHIPLPFVMGYDTRPLLTLKEKKQFLDEAAKENYYLFLEHDAHNEIINLKETEKGIRLNQIYTFNELFN
ncbi:MBL fold metallo-hydrolase [Psychroflexus planctonicus]|uniref:MBL fold metallo-hydrolase n=1 Tax=Psychroflexus planctonicus TaxID=1526575 RepID=A0ABQ1SID6_9FLAO|nr:MBL fold metallo-hydrolase [Psychroflexus planctonicus]GGE38081.1 MBL fold metallo-hydrolase [Psychroflexus planctonicus]